MIESAEQQAKTVLGLPPGVEVADESSVAVVYRRLVQAIRAAQIDALRAARECCYAEYRDDGSAQRCADAIAALIEEVERVG